VVEMQDKAEQLRRHYVNTFGSESGKWVLDDLKRHSTFNRSSVTANRERPIDVNRLIYDEGARAVILYITKKLARDTKVERPDKAEDSNNG